MNAGSSRRSGLTRWDFLVAGGGTVVGAHLLASCDLLSTEPREKSRTDRTGTESRGKEAPQLAEMVKQGKLPPVEERLPEKPLTVEPVERMGVYGGELRRALTGGQDAAWLGEIIDYENLVRWHPERSETIPNVAESVERNEEGTEYTFVLRKGMKWSDGEPFTADDIVFWYEDVFQNDELLPVKDSWMLTNDEEPGVVEKVDDRTVKFRFAAPNGLLLQQLATNWTGGPTDFPRHYLERFHKAHNSDGIEQLVEEAGLDDWVALFWAKADTWANTERPTLHAWKMITALGESSTARVVAERNPYYWKVDPDGSQLPYIDRVVHELVADLETAVLKTANGEYNLPVDVNTLANKAVFASSREQGDYHFVETLPGEMNTAILFLNLTHKDPVKREIFQNKDFRIALSHAINRREIIDVVFFGQGEPWQAAPREESEYYNETLAKQYTEYDVDLANEHLDKAGYTERDSESFRLGPNGQRIFIAAETPSDRKPESIDVLELVKNYWREVGIDMQIKTEGSSLFWTRMEGNDHDAMIWHGDGGIAVITAPYYYFPYNFACKYAPAWGHWYTGDSRGEKPPEAVRKQMEFYDQIKETPDPEEQARLMKQILEIAVDQFNCIGTVLSPMGYEVVKNNFHNVPEPAPIDWYHSSFARTNTCQYFIEG
jgi:peptide/nickel transport system substrate-binding protein